MAEKTELTDRVDPCAKRNCSSFKKFFCRYFGVVNLCQAFDEEQARMYQRGQTEEDPSPLPPPVSQNYQIS